MSTEKQYQSQDVTAAQALSQIRGMAPPGYGSMPAQIMMQPQMMPPGYHPFNMQQVQFSNQHQPGSQPGMPQPMPSTVGAPYFTVPPHAGPPRPTFSQPPLQPQQSRNEGPPLKKPRVEPIRPTPSVASMEKQKSSKNGSISSVAPSSPNSLQSKQDIVVIAAATASMTANAAVSAKFNVLQAKIEELRQGLASQVSRSIKKSNSEAKIVSINVGGRVFSTLKATISQLPNSVLASIGSSNCGFPEDEQGRPFIDRDPDRFAQILDFLRDPTMNITSWAKHPAMISDLKYFGIYDRVKAALKKSDGKKRTIFAAGGINEVLGSKKYLNIVEAYDEETDTWSTAPSMYWHRHHSGCVTADERMWMLGGQGEREDGVVGSYDGDKNEWHEVSNMMLPVRTIGSSFASLDALILMTGGNKTTSDGLPILECSDDTFVYDLQAARSGSRSVWIKGRPLATPRSRHQCIIVDGEAYILGGVGSDGHTLRSVEKRSSDGEWTKIAEMPIPRRDFGCVVVENRIYVIGGTSKSFCPPGGAEKNAEDDDEIEIGSTSCLSSVIYFDVSSGTWKQCADMTFPRMGLACAALDHYIYAIGGGDVDEELASSERSRVVERFDTRTNTWERVAHLNHGRCFLSGGVVQSIL